MDPKHADFLLLILFSMVSVPVCVIDIRTRRISDRIILPAVLLIFFVRIIVSRQNWAGVVIETASGFLLFYCVYVLTGAKIGMGDVKFSALMACFLGFPGWVYATASASLLGLWVGVSGLLGGYLKRETRIPFAPFLTAGSVIGYFIDRHAPCIFRGW